MDLDEMKAGWSVLNARLAQNEIINQRIIKEMITNRTKSAYDQIYRSELYGLCLVLAVGLFLLPGNMFSETPLKRSTFIFLEIIMLFAFLSRFFLLYTLSRFNLREMKVKELTYWVLKYKKFYGYNVKYGSGLGLGAIAVFLLWENTYTSLGSVFMITGMLIVAMAYAWPKTQKHIRRIGEIEEGLAELKEFESTEENTEE